VNTATREKIVLGLMLCYALPREEAEGVVDEHEAATIDRAADSLQEYLIPRKLRSWWRMAQLDAWIEGRERVMLSLYRRAELLRRRAGDRVGRRTSVSAG
jgi:hypothetical protein